MGLADMVLLGLGNIFTAGLFPDPYAGPCLIIARKSRDHIDRQHKDNDSH